MGAEEYDDAVERAAVDHRFRPKEVLTAQQFERITSLREGARLFSRHLLKLCPPSWEKDEALRLIRSAMLHAEAGIRCNE